jgi:hypothetical protein
VFCRGAAGGNFAARVATHGTAARSNAETLSDTDSDEDRLSAASRPHAATSFRATDVERPRGDGRMEPPPSGAYSLIGSDNIYPMDRARRTGDIVAGANFGPPSAPRTRSRRPFLPKSVSRRAKPSPRLWPMPVQPYYVCLNPPVDCRSLFPRPSSSAGLPLPCMPRVIVKVVA